MTIAFLPGAREDYQFWLDTDRKVLKRVNLVIKDCVCEPLAGIGKPEPLRHDWAGWWSRRITGEHRLIYRVFGEGKAATLEIAQCWHHY